MTIENDTDTPNTETPVTPPAATVEHHTTVIKESGGGMGMGSIFLIGLLVLGVIGFWFINQQSDKDIAIKDAAESVGAAADKAGAAADSVGNAVDDAAEKMK